MEERDNLNKTYHDFMDIFCSHKEMIDDDSYIFVIPNPVSKDNKLFIVFVAYNQKKDVATNEIFIPLTDIAIAKNPEEMLIKVKLQLIEELKKL